MSVPMKKIWTARALIRNGFSVKEVAIRLNMSESTVRKYTKAEREMVKTKKDMVHTRG
jgi:transposase